jgi:transaldolase
MKPTNLKTKIFLDSGDPAETKEALSILGFLDGQTTNPSLIAKNPATAGKKFSKNKLADFYKEVVGEISLLIPQGSVSIEVYADQNTLADEMLEQARGFWQWIPNAHIKYPTTTEGLKAAEISVKEGMWVNMTLVFNQEQAAAVYAATLGAKKGDVFLSPFVGRLDDRGEDGMDLIKNVVQMYRSTPSLNPSPLSASGRGKETGDGHVEVLVASVRSMEHFLKSIELGADIITAPLKILKDWASASFPLPLGEGQGEGSKLAPIPYQKISLTKPWQKYNIQHELTDKGIEKFAQDWNNLIIIP